MGTAPYVSTPRDIENALRSPFVGRPDYEVMFPMGNCRMPPKTSFTCSAFEGISPQHTILRGSNDPATVALESYGPA